MTSHLYPGTRGAIHAAALLIIAHGPRTIPQLFSAIDFGAHGTERAKIRGAIEAGWLIETDAGIDVTEFLRAHLTALPKQKYIGQVAPPAYRADVFATTLSRRFIPDRRGPRADVPAWSVRPDGYAIKTTGGA